MIEDYCKSCVTECGCDRLDTVIEPVEIECTVDADALRMTATYRCLNGHVWTCRFTEPLHADLKG